MMEIDENAMKKQGMTMESAMKWILQLNKNDFW